MVAGGNPGPRLLKTALQFGLSRHNLPVKRTQSTRIGAGAF